MVAACPQPSGLRPRGDYRYAMTQGHQADGTAQGEHAGRRQDEGLHRVPERAEGERRDQGARRRGRTLCEQLPDAGHVSRLSFTIGVTAL